MKLTNIGPHENEVELGNGDRVLFSYQTLVAAVVNGTAYRTEKYWSVTTSKHINRWLNGEIAESKPQDWFDTLTSH